jgi:hypothetical protein
MTITMDLNMIHDQQAVSRSMDRVSSANAGLYDMIYGAGVVAHEVDHIMNTPFEQSRAGSFAHEISAFTANEMVWRNFGIRNFEHTQGWGYGDEWIRKKAQVSTNRWCQGNPAC